jgi:hypothetical protein
MNFLMRYLNTPAKVCAAASAFYAIVVFLVLALFHVVLWASIVISVGMLAIVFLIISLPMINAGL